MFSRSEGTGPPFQPREPHERNPSLPKRLLHSRIAQRRRLLIPPIPPVVDPGQLPIPYPGMADELGHPFDVLEEMEEPSWGQMARVEDSNRPVGRLDPPPSRLPPSLAADPVEDSDLERARREEDR